MMAGRMETLGVTVLAIEPTHINKQLAKHDKMNKCECGCGVEVHRRFLNGHQRKGKKAYPGEYDSRSGSNCSSWKGGRAKHSSGYILIYQPDHHFHDNRGYVLEHRLVWEEHNKACLLPWGDIHHKNKNVTDNQIVNLEAMMHSKHMSHHSQNQHIPRWDLSNRFIIEWRLKWRWLFPKEFYK